MTMTPDEFVLGRSGKWLSLGHFFKMPVPDRRAEFVFGTAAEVMQMMSDLPTKAQVFRPPAKGTPATPDRAADEMANAFRPPKTRRPEKPKSDSNHNSKRYEQEFQIRRQARN